MESGDIDLAQKHRTELLSLIETMYDQKNPETIKMRVKELILTAHVLLSQKRWKEALEHLECAKTETSHFVGHSSSETKNDLLKAQTMITINDLQAYVYEKQNRYDEALLILNEAVTLTSEIYGPNSEQFAKVLATQGFLYAKMEEGDKAITNFKRSTTIYISCQGAVNYEDYMKSLDTMISIYMQREETGIAKMVLQDKLATGLQFKGERSSVVATTYKELGIMSFQDENYEEALGHFSQSVDVGTYVYKSDDIEFLNCLRYYAVTSDILGKYDDALNAYQQILDLVENREKLPIHNAMGFICNATDRHDEALSHFNEALKLQSAQGPDIDEDSTTDRSTLMNHLGNVYASKDKLVDALYCYDLVIDSVESSKTAQEERLTAINNKTTVLCNNKKYLDAKICVKEGLHLARTLQKPESMRLLWSGLGACEFALGNYEKAIKCFKQSIDLGKSRGVLTKSDIGMKFNMGLAYLKLGYSYNSISIFQEALENLENLKDSGTDEMAELKADILYNMGNMYLKENQMREANIFFVKAIQAAGNSEDSNQTVVLRSRHSLALIICKDVKYKRKGADDLDNAINIFQKVRTETIKTYGEDHVDVAKISVDIAVAFYLQGNYEEAQEKCDIALKVFSDKVSVNHSYYRQATRLKQSISRKMFINRIGCKSNTPTPQGQ